MDTEQKLNILAESSKFDLACSCKPKTEPGRVRGDAGRWIYPAVLPSGKPVFLLKTLQTNSCMNDCVYCPFNCRRDGRRMTLAPKELAATFMELHRADLVTGLVLSSGIERNADATMSEMLATVELLRRRHAFKGFVHLKVIPGCSDAAIDRAVQMATRVSVNIEAPTAGHLTKLATGKRFHEDIIAAMRSINRARCAQKRRNCSQTTQFVVGAAEESDRDIVTTTDALYRRMDMERVYFSAYQNPTAAPQPKQGTLFTDIPPEKTRRNHPIFVREHRLYQVDFLLRRYRFSRDEILFDHDGHLNLEKDPKQTYADAHPELFPVDPNTADRDLLLRVPGIGPLGAKRIIDLRRRQRITKSRDLKNLRVRTTTAQAYLKLRD